MTLNYLEIIAGEYPDEYARVRCVTNLRQQEEAERWRDIINRMYLPEDKELGIFVQNDGFLDKELNSTDAIPPEERPINQHWSWDRILRSCYIKQSDVLLGLYLYYFNFDKETVRRNFDFPRTSTPFLPPALAKWKRLTNSFCMPPVLTWMTTTTKLTKDCISPVCRAAGLPLYEASPECRSWRAYSLSSQSFPKNGAVIPSR